ncbi:MAG: hypothetical protein A2086_10585 [Spirochaetes bacterium GWD1_27_9]|nr:MAG: hypothetical protein A2Z98_17820 [Spirochaetes bacterium GWB1_27_13]OHD30923.1 MAG: hypothetical protein A2086_10585 [Spirochaetes bacterium GWD1_27_9]
MLKFLITGCSGFVGKHFLNYLEDNKIKSFVLGIDVVPLVLERNYKNIKISFTENDLMDKDKIQYIIYDFKPNYIIHLASYSSVAFSWQNPIISFQNNTNIFLNLLEAVKVSKGECRVLSIGSSEEYGNVTDDKIPLKEDYDLSPVSPYAVARVAQELLSKVYVNGYGQDIIITRSFNNIGPGQRENFVIPSFAKQLVELKLQNKKEGEIVVGDISIIRDFLDIRDVVCAYYMLLMNGKSGEVYNVCSGNGYSLKQVIDMMGEILNIKVNIKVNKNLIRPNDNKIIIGANDKLKKDIGWENKIAFKNTLCDIIEEWLSKLSNQ